MAKSSRNKCGMYLGIEMCLSGAFAQGLSLLLLPPGRCLAGQGWGMRLQGFCFLQILFRGKCWTFLPGHGWQVSVGSAANKRAQFVSVRMGQGSSFPSSSKKLPAANGAENQGGTRGEEPLHQLKKDPLSKKRGFRVSYGKCILNNVIDII